MSLDRIIEINRRRVGLDPADEDGDRRFSHETGALERLCIYGRMRPGGPDNHRLTQFGGEWMEGTFPGTLQGDLCTLDECPGLAWMPTKTWNAGFVLTSNLLRDAWPELDAKEGENYARLLTPVRVGDTDIVANIYTSRSASLQAIAALSADD
ncbi:MAG: hypothetical protein JJ855_10265 [Rhodospirillales bacterium]|nr:hypothetical protein [Rhodospirillales bacterium]